MQCLICSGLNINEFKTYSHLKRVTSDAKLWPEGGHLNICTDCGHVQKKVTEKWLSEIENIYLDYNLYPQSDGHDQAIFSENGEAFKRSSILSDYLKKELSTLSDNANILDYGCGNGEFLSQISKSWPSKNLYGFDISDKFSSQLYKISNFKQILKPNDNINQKFELITLIHSLEHIYEPLKILNSIKNMLHSSGMLFIQVPDINQNMFDILIADHVSHFTLENLENLLGIAGFKILDSKTDLVAKEITVLAKIKDQDDQNTDNYVMNNQYQINHKIVENYINSLQKFVDIAKKIDDFEEYSIFGTSISATWLTGYCQNVSYYLDEDPNRIGGTHLGKKILHPNKIIQQSLPIIMPLAFPIMQKIRERYPFLNVISA